MLERKGTWGAFLTPRHPGHPPASLLGADGLPPTLPWARLPIVATTKPPLQGSGSLILSLSASSHAVTPPAWHFPLLGLSSVRRPTRSPAVCAAILLSSRRPAQRSHLPLKSFKAGGFQTPDAISVIRLCFRKGFWTKDVARPAWPGLLHRAASPLPSAGVSGPHGQLQPAVQGSSRRGSSQST